ncbi:MAG TPA: glycosyltransferase family 2 protein [Vicinamibacterales bacterium]|jgi:glycosyltransferase involved in cell wall biosynthesis
MIRVSILVPAYNEEATIVNVLERVRAQHVDDVAFEVIVVNDGSKDGTRRQLEARPDLYDTLINHEVNSGKGAAVKSALRAATGDYVLFQDADLEYDPSEYEKLLLPVRQFDADIVVGSRFLAPLYTRVHYLWHKIGNKAITNMFNVMFNKTFTDLYTCYVLFRRRLIDADELRTTGWEQQAEILCLVIRRSKTHYEVPIAYHGRTYDQGKKIRAHHAAIVLWTIIRTRFRSVS